MASMPPPGAKGTTISIGRPAGAIAAGATCGVQQGPGIVRSSALCAANAENIYNNWNSRQSDVQNACGQARTGCTGGGGTPTASFDRAIE